MKLVLPKQHGAWAMLILPFVLGIVVGTPTLLHLLLFIGWLMLYLATYPFIMAFRNRQREHHFKWFIRYFVIALLTLAIPIIIVPELILFGLAMAPFFFINLYYAKQNNERALLNDFSAIFSFGIGGVASYYFGTGYLDGKAFLIWFLTVLFFMGSTFFVKTLIREKNNKTFRWVSWGFHLGVILLMIGIGYPIFALAYVPSVIRAIWCYGKSMSPKQIGILEIFNSAYFLVFLAVV